jgi:osmoprotectant transport system substrate-binding protein
VRRAARAALAVSLGALVAGGWPGASSSRTAAARRAPGPTIVIGTKRSSEEHILGRLYGLALAAKGFHVVYRDGIGDTGRIQAALKGGRIDFYPEYTGVIVQDIFHRTLPRSASATYRLAKRLEAAGGYSLLDATPFEHTHVVVVTDATAAKDGLRAIGDLKKIGSFAFGGCSSCCARFEKAYRLTAMTCTPLPGSSVYAALDAGRIQAGDALSTDPPLGSGSAYSVLADPKHVTGFGNVAPVVKTSVLESSDPSLAKTVNAVSAKLTLDVVVAMNRVVQVDRQDPARVAEAFLKANGLG